MSLIDLTLMAANRHSAAPETVRRLYEALLRVGVMVQIPYALVEVLSGVLAPEKTILDLGVGDPTPAGFAGYLRGVGDRRPKRSVFRYLSGARAVSRASGYRLLVDADWMLDDYPKLFAYFSRRISTPVTLCAQGATTLSTALTIDWLLEGYGSATVCFMGEGGFASLAETAMALALHGRDAINTRALKDVADAWEAFTGKTVPPYQPVIGRRIFDVSSGVHVNGLLKDTGSYEPFSPETVNGQRRIVLGKHSGASAVAARLTALGLDPACYDLPRLARRVRDAGAATGEVEDAAFLQMTGHCGKEAQA